MKTIIEYIDGQLQEHADVAPALVLNPSIYGMLPVPSVQFIDRLGHVIKNRVVALDTVKRVTFETE